MLRTHPSQVSVAAGELAKSIDPRAPLGQLPGGNSDYKKKKRSQKKRKPKKKSNSTETEDTKITHLPTVSIDSQASVGNHALTDTNELKSAPQGSETQEAETVLQAIEKSTHKTETSSDTSTPLQTDEDASGSDVENALGEKPVEEVSVQEQSHISENGKIAEASVFIPAEKENDLSKIETDDGEHIDVHTTSDNNQAGDCIKTLESQSHISAESYSEGAATRGQTKELSEKRDKDSKIPDKQRHVGKGRASSVPRSFCPLSKFERLLSNRGDIQIPLEEVDVSKETRRWPRHEKRFHFRSLSVPPRMSGMDETDIKKSRDMADLAITADSISPVGKVAEIDESSPPFENIEKRESAKPEICLVQEGSGNSTPSVQSAQLIQPEITMTTSPTARLAADPAIIYAELTSPEGSSDKWCAENQSTTDASTTSPTFENLIARLADSKRKIDLGNDEAGKPCHNPEARPFIPSQQKPGEVNGCQMHPRPNFFPPTPPSSFQPLIAPPFPHQMGHAYLPSQIDQSFVGRMPTQFSPIGFPPVPPRFGTYLPHIPIPTPPGTPIAAPVWPLMPNQMPFRGFNYPVAPFPVWPPPPIPFNGGYQQHTNFPPMPMSSGFHQNINYPPMPMYTGYQHNLNFPPQEVNRGYQQGIIQPPVTVGSGNQQEFNGPHKPSSSMQHQNLNAHDVSHAATQPPRVEIQQPCNSRNRRYRKAKRSDLHSDSPAAANGQSWETGRQFQPHQSNTSAMGMSHAPVWPLQQSGYPNTFNPGVGFHNRMMPFQQWQRC
ncbi:hypothetical protein L228DRAFT_274722 [Xylona heveae TC161]|uniref:Uncharacterized protein n=1 Tax=Xylona heveae (strain CBS 132557 / TC161) TaxID=1328760 RepID=A0A165IQU5_XYLHT|nr:hypothetical protein L228DRAFT_274722 [Xylona heveae TC161]KZF25250.1 hypothetical protein L228DRAFT_274722 [Xylona heveae TC161]